MKKIVSYLVIIALLFCVGCSMKLSTQELSKEIETAISKDLTSKNTGLIVKSLTLIKESENNYSGIVTIKDAQGDSSKHDIKVIYDGENTKWEIPSLHQKVLSLNVKKSINELFVSKNIKLNAESLTLNRVFDNKYSGKLLITNEDGDSKYCDIEIIDDGENQHWEIDESEEDLKYFSLSRQDKNGLNLLKWIYNQ